MSDFSFSLYGNSNGGYHNVPDGSYTLPMSGVRAQVAVNDPNNTESRIYNAQDGTLNATTGYSNSGPDIIHGVPNSIVATVVNNHVTIPATVGPFTITLDAQDSASVNSGNYELIADCAYYLLILIPGGGSQSLGYHYANYTQEALTPVIVGPNTVPGGSPALLGRPSRHYNRAVAKLNSTGSDTVGITFWRSDKAVPCMRDAVTRQVWDTPSAGVAVTTTAGDRDPRLAEDARTLLYLIFNRPASGAMMKRSDDDGATWNTPTLAITGGRHPNIISGSGRTLAAAVTGSGTTMHITGVYRAPGDAAFGTAFTFNTSTTGSAGSPLVVADDSFGLAFAAEGPDRIVMHVLLAADAATSDSWSANNGATWTRIPLV